MFVASQVLLFMNLFYSPAYVLSSYAFDTTRKAQWIAESLQCDLIAGVALCVPESVSEVQLCATHNARYVTAVRTGTPRRLAESSDLEWNPCVWPMVCATTGGIVAAALCALRDGVAGSLSSGLHHATHAHGAGFCTFNGLVVAARAALAAGAQSILLLDLDAHCGGGTYELLWDEPWAWHCDVATHLYDYYQPYGHHTLDVVLRADDYLRVMAARLAELEQRAPRFDLCLYNAGMDPFERCELGGLEGITRETLAERERMVFAWCARRNIPIAFASAGGYVGAQMTRAELVALHRLTIQAATSPPNPPVYRGTNGLA